MSKKHKPSKDTKLNITNIHRHTSFFLSGWPGRVRRAVPLHTTATSSTNTQSGCFSSAGSSITSRPISRSAATYISCCFLAWGWMRNQDDVYILDWWGDYGANCVGRWGPNWALLASFQFQCLSIYASARSPSHRISWATDHKALAPIITPARTMYSLTIAIEHIVRQPYISLLNGCFCTSL